MRSNERPAFIVWPKTQEDNYGDLVICRSLLQLLQNYGDVHVLSNEVSSSFLAAVAPSGVELHSSGGFRDSASIARKIGRSRAVYFVETPGHKKSPGKRPSLVSELLHTSALVELLVARARYVRIGCTNGPFRGIERHRETALQKAAHFYSDRSEHQDERTAQYFPDLALLRDYRPGLAGPARRRAGVSMRRDSLIGESKSFWQAVVEGLKEQQLDPEIVCQVGSDESVLADLAATHNVEIRFVRSELEERRVYGTLKQVVTDRMHVAILAAQNGATALPVVTSEGSKLARFVRGTPFEERAFKPTQAIPELLDRDHERWIRAYRVWSDQQKVLATKSLKELVSR